MPKTLRFGVAMDEGLLVRFDRLIREQKYTNRSEALRDLVRRELVSREWEEERQVAGAITLVFDHHQRALMGKLTAIQHDFGSLILSTQHIHLDHHHCLEIIAVRGSSRDALRLSDRLKAVKGVKHGTLSMSSTGKGLA